MLCQSVSISHLSFTEANLGPPHPSMQLVGNIWYLVANDSMEFDFKIFSYCNTVAIGLMLARINSAELYDNIRYYLGKSRYLKILDI